MQLLPKFLRDLRYRAFYSLLLDRGHNLVTLGDVSYGLQWTICPDALNPNSIVYSGGVGGDISFEHELVKRYGCQVLMLDPSPTGVKTMALPENKIPQFKFLPLALAREAGELVLAPPVEGGDAWLSGGGGPGTIRVPSTNLTALMKMHGHSHIDLLKLDIEGCEFEVVDDILENRIPVRQLCADFEYYQTPGATRGQAIRAILKLRQAGYRLIHFDSANHTFLAPAARVGGRA